MGRVVTVDHPLVQHKLTLLRETATGAKEFRELLDEIATMLAYEATRDLPTVPVAVRTPLTTAAGARLAGKHPAVVPILRAGLGMVNGFLRLLPTAVVGHIGLFRDPQTLAAVEYYCKLPPDLSERVLLVLDPMLATGGSAVAAIQLLKNRGARHIKLITLIACPEGLAAVQTAHPDVTVFTAGIDARLNDHAYIVPGLGDAGDRLFGTI